MALYISTRYIAEATGKRHKDVLRDVRKQCRVLDINIVKLNQTQWQRIIQLAKPSGNQLIPVVHVRYEEGGDYAIEYYLDENSVFILLSVYDTALRAEEMKIINTCKPKQELK
jgi:phage regulator Rha-like protein